MNRNDKKCIILNTMQPYSPLLDRTAIGYIIVLREAVLGDQLYVAGCLNTVIIQDVAMVSWLKWLKWLAG
jgi:hypothetical protein